MTPFPEYTLLDGKEAALATSASQLDSCSLEPRWIWYTGPMENPSIIGRCRLVASSLEELEAIDGLASRAGLKKGRLEMVGLRIIPSVLGNPSLGGIPEDELPEVKRTLSALRHISVNGCFASLQGDGKRGKELGECFRVSYELGKRLYAFLPATMAYIGICGVGEAIRSEADDPVSLEETARIAQIVAQQNETAFYATLLLS